MSVRLPADTCPIPKPVFKLQQDLPKETSFETEKTTESDSHISKSKIVALLKKGHVVTLYNKKTTLIFHGRCDADDHKEKSSTPAAESKFFFFEVSDTSSRLREHKWPAYIKKNACGICRCSLKQRALEHLNIMEPTEELPHSFNYVIPPGSKSTKITHGNPTPGKPTPHTALHTPRNPNSRFF